MQRVSSFQPFMGFILVEANTLLSLHALQMIDMRSFAVIRRDCANVGCPISRSRTDHIAPQKDYIPLDGVCRKDTLLPF
jgi:hypothetical protein